MDWWQALILGLVEGITEYLPVSSTGHLIIAGGLMGLDTPEQKAAVDAFTIIVQGGAILAVLGLYRVRIAQMLAGLVGRNPRGLRLALLLILAFLPAAVLGLLFNDPIEAHLFYLGPVAAALILGGVYMILLDRRRLRPLRIAESTMPGDPGDEWIDSLTPVKALLIGLLQCIAMWPGVSRSMMTISGGLLVGLRPARAAEFSFLLGLPTLGAATLYSLYKNVTDAQASGIPNLFEALGLSSVVLGIIAAGISAWFAVRWLVAFLNRHGLELFGWYRIAAGLILLALGGVGVVKVLP